MEYGRSYVRGARASACLNEDGAGTPYQPHEQLPRNIGFSLKHRFFVQNGKILRRAVASSTWRIVALCCRIHSDNVWRVIIIHRFRGVCCWRKAFPPVLFFTRHKIVSVKAWEATPRSDSRL